MSPLSDLLPDPLPGQPVTCLKGPALTSRGFLGGSPSGLCLISSPDSPSPFQVRRGLGATPPPSSLAPVSALNLKAATEGGTMHMSSGPKPFNSWPHGHGWGAVALTLPPWWTRPGALPSWSLAPPHAALASHTNPPRVNVASIITDCHSSRVRGGLEGGPSGHGLGWPFRKTRQLGPGL